MTRPVRPVVLRNGVEIEDPLTVALEFLRAYGHLELRGASPAASFGEPDLRLANRGGARISAAEIETILARRRSIERPLRAIPPHASLAGPTPSVVWGPLAELFGAFAELRGVGFSKMTKALHPKRPALIPMLDSFVQKYLHDDDPGSDAPFGERALSLVRSYKRDLDGNGAAIRAVRKELANRGYELTEVRLLDVLIWSVEAAG